MRKTPEGRAEYMRVYRAKKKLEAEMDARLGLGPRPIVECVRGCGAWLHPVTLAEHRRAIDHWLNHRS